VNAWLTFGVGSWAVHVTCALNRTDEIDDDESADTGCIESLVERAEIHDEREQLGFRIPRPRPPSM
jgi:hypothetical protein